MEERHGNSSINSKAKTPNLPSFEDTEDDIDAYLHRFEMLRIAVGHGMSGQSTFVHY